MGKRISYSILDPWLTVPLKRLYHVLPIPRRFPPEGIVIGGHLLAIVAAFGFAFSTTRWWGGLLAALGVALNHVLDCLDGTHARATGQCRNGGELLDHFFDPLSFACWLVGMAVSCGRLDLGLAAVIGLYATAVLTNIRAKMIGEFVLARFGSTEFKALLACYALGQALLTSGVVARPAADDAALAFLVVLLVVGIGQLVLNLVRAVRAVNAHGAPPDTGEWQHRRGGGGAGPAAEPGAGESGAARGADP